MLVLSRDGGWRARLEKLAGRDGWPFEAREALPRPGMTPPPERALVILDRALAGAAPKDAVAALRAIYAGTAVVLAFNAGELDHDGANAAVTCGADEILAKSWSDEKIIPALASLRDRALSAQLRLSADGGLKAERRAHRVLVKSGGRWKDLSLDAGGFALLWRLLDREGEAVSREDLAAALACAAGRELEMGTVVRRLASLKKALRPWKGTLESARGGLYRLASSRRRSA